MIRLGEGGGFAAERVGFGEFAFEGGVEAIGEGLGGFAGEEGEGGAGLDADVDGEDGRFPEGPTFLEEAGV